MNVILLNPPPSEESWYRSEHLGIAYLGAVLRQTGHRVLLLDSLLEDLDVHQTFQAILQRMPMIDVLGITATEPETLKAGIAVVRLLNQTGKCPHVTCGGYLPTFWSEEVLQKYPEIDTVVVGEGEETLRVLVETLQRDEDLACVKGIIYRGSSGQFLHTPPRPLISDLDCLPFPARDYLKVAYQRYHHALVYTSRGCYHKCSFCQIAQFYRLSPGKPYRTRSAKNIADEIELLVNRYGVRSIFFVDDEFITESHQRRRVIEELIAEIRARRLQFSFSIQYRADTGSDEALLHALKEIGLSTVFIGVESGVDSVLKRFDKGINRDEISKALEIVEKLEFNHNIGYILFNPGTTFAELLETVNYLLSPQGPTILKLIGMMVLKGTPEEKFIQEQDLITERDLGIRYKFTDEKVAAFAGLLRRYARVYEPTAKDYYEIHFMIGDLDDFQRNEMMSKIKPVELKIRSLHQGFLACAVNQLLKGDLYSNTWIADLIPEFEALHDETQSILQEGIGKISAREKV
jgi:anaerobic magnesium-protoporphyrin IX monomethyl ester cyclase